MSEAVRRRARAAVEERKGRSIEPSPPTKSPEGCGTAATDTSARSALLCLAGVLTAVAVPTALLAIREAVRLRDDKLLLEDQLWEERTARIAAERQWHRVAELQPRADNLPWQERLQRERKLREQHENSDEFINELFDNPWRRFPNGANLSEWEALLRTQTPSRFDAARVEGEEGGDADKAPAFCHELHGVVISERELNEPVLSDAARARALRALTECGYVYLDNIIPKERVRRLREAYMAFRETDEAADFLYPCQGEGRVEHMLPFREPFNTSEIYADPRLMTVLGDFFNQEQFKMELMTVITSPPGSGDQRWHQGWRYLFHPDERLPPFAAVVALPLADVSPEMGPTEMCPGKKLRFYRGYRCQDHLRMATTEGTIAIFDYKTLHRGPGNAHPTKERAMVSMVFSKMFFLNTEAIINRGISLLQTLHQRRYWEQFTWHPRSVDDQFAV